MGFTDEFVNDDEKIEKMSKYSGARGGKFELKTLQLGGYMDVKFLEIKRVFNEKTTRYNKNGAWSGIAKILSISGKEYHGMEVNLWLSDNMRNNMVAELRKRKTPLTEQTILGNFWRIFATQNKGYRIYSAVLVEGYEEKADTQASSGGMSAEDMFR